MHRAKNVTETQNAERQNIECGEFLKSLEAMYVTTLIFNFPYKTPTCSLNYQVFDFLGQLCSLLLQVKHYFYSCKTLQKHGQLQ